ncbi:MAG: proton-conducting transporter membrane subunit [Candidatus Woesearchaeota archaeon]
MIRLFFIALLAIFATGSLIYHIYNERKRLLLSIPTLIGAAFIIGFAPWYLCAVGFILMLLPLFWKTSYGNIMDSCMIGAIMASLFFYELYSLYHIPWLILIGILMAIVICFLAVLGILQEDIKKFIILSNIIQFLFVFLDISVAKATGKLATLGTIQILNYAIVGTLFFLALGMISNSMGWISSLRGLYYRYPVNGFALIIAGISLAGVPGLNIFISEWLLFKTAFALSPIITVAGIFAALLLFIMYIKFAYILLAGEVLEKEHSPMPSKAYNVILSVTCFVIGIIPWIQFKLLEAVFG